MSPLFFRNSMNVLSFHYGQHFLSLNRFFITRSVIVSQLSPEEQVISHICAKKNINVYESNFHSRRKVLLYNNLLVRNYSSVVHDTLPKQNFIFTYLSESSPVLFTKDLIVSCHNITHLPWWANIMLITIFLRVCVTLPLLVYQHYILAKVENIASLEMPEFAQQLKLEIAKKAQTLNWSNEIAKRNFKIEMKKHWNFMIQHENCHPLKSVIIVLVQLPTWIFFSAALRNISYMLPHRDAAAEIIFLELGVGGFLWIPNLTQPDGTLILPILLGLSNLAIIEIQSLMRLKEPTKLQKFTKHVFQIFSLVLVPISATFPSSVALYWTTSSVLALSQNLLLLSNRFRSFCRIPDTPSTLNHPYHHIFEEMKGKFSKRTKGE